MQSRSPVAYDAWINLRGGVPVLENSQDTLENIERVWLKADAHFACALQSKFPYKNPGLTIAHRVPPGDCPRIDGRSAISVGLIRRDNQEFSAADGNSASAQFAPTLAREAPDKNKLLTSGDSPMPMTGRARKVTDNRRQ